MSKKYQLSEEILLQIIKISYEAGCNGYMDLKESVSQELLFECIKMCKPIMDYLSNDTFNVQTTYLNTNVSVSNGQNNFVGDQFNFYSNV